MYKYSVWSEAALLCLKYPHFMTSAYKDLAEEINQYMIK